MYVFFEVCSLFSLFLQNEIFAIKNSYLSGKGYYNEESEAFKVTAKIFDEFDKIDLMNAFDTYGPEFEVKDLCSGHYTPLGNEIVAKHIAKYVSFLNFRVTASLLNVKPLWLKDFIKLKTGFTLKFKKDTVTGQYVVHTFLLGSPLMLLRMTTSQRADNLLFCHPERSRRTTFAGSH